MTGPAPAAPPPPDDLTARVFRALYPEFDLYHADGAYLAVAKGTPCFGGPSLGAIARQISDHEHPCPPPPGTPPDPG